MIARYRKKYHATFGILIGFVVIIGIFIYFNYDYLAFKHFITSSYIYTETLDDLYKKYLDIDTTGRYYNDFDNFVIAATTERIRAERGTGTHICIPLQAWKSPAGSIKRKQHSRKSGSWMTLLSTSN